MRKSTLLTLASMAVMGVLKAQTPGPVIEVPADAEARNYSLSGFYYEDHFLDILDGTPETVYFTSESVYFSNLFPRQLGKAPVMGAYDAENGTITVKKQHFMNYDLGEQVVPFYFTVLQVDADGQALGSSDQDFVLQIDADGVITTVGGSAVWFGVVDSDDNVVTRARNLAMSPFDGVETILPDDAEPVEYMYSVYDHREDAPKVFFADVAFVGNEVYMNGLTMNQHWLKGILEGDRLIMPNNQYMGDDDWGFIYVVNGVTNFHRNPETYMEEYDMADAITFTLKDGVFVLDEGLAIAEMTPTGGVRCCYSDVEIKLFEGYVAATPMDPFNVWFMDMSEWMSQMAIMFQVSNVGTEGEFLNVENLEVSVFVDGEQYTFDPEDGYPIAEKMTWIPYGFVDDSWGMNLYFESLNLSFYLFETIATEMGAQVRYTCDGETRYSNIVYADLDGNTRTEYYNPTGISQLPQQMAVQSYDLNGRRMGMNDKGFGIVRVQGTEGVKTLKVLRK